MGKSADITFQDNKFLVTGDLDFSNVMDVFEKSLSQMTEPSKLIIDFSLLNSSNSAGFALMIEWIKFAKRQGKSIYFKNLSQHLLSFAKLSGLNELILECD